MAFKFNRPTFEFVGNLEILKEGKNSKGETTQGTVRDNGNGFVKLVFGANAGKQGTFFFEVNGFSNPVNFTLNEVDSKGNNKTYSFSGGKLKYKEDEIKDLWKSKFVIKQGDKEQIFYHSKDFVECLKKMIPSIEKGKDKIFYKINGVVDKSGYNKKIIEKYTISSIEIMTEKKLEHYFRINEVFVYKREDLKGVSIPVFESIRLSTKDKGGLDFLYRSEKKLKFHKDWLMGGNFDSIPLKENPVLDGYLKDLVTHEIGKFRVNYKPVINNTKVEKEETVDLKDIPYQYRQAYEKLVELGHVEKAKNVLASVSNLMRASEGGGFREYYIDTFDFSSDIELGVSETVFKEEFLETNIDNIILAQKKENKGKLLKDTLLINKPNNDLISTDTDSILGGDFDNLLDNNNDILSDTSENNEKLEVNESNDNVETELEDKPKEKVIEDNADEFDKIFGTNNNEDTKGDEEDSKVSKDTTNNDEEEDVFKGLF